MYLKWICDHRSESQVKQLRNSPKKVFRGYNPVEAPKNFFRAISQLLNLRFTAMVTYSFHFYSRSSHHFILCLMYLPVFVLNASSFIKAPAITILTLHTPHLPLFLGRILWVDRVSVQGKPNSEKSVTQYFVKTSTDNVNFQNSLTTLNKKVARTSLNIII